MKRGLLILMLLLAACAGQSGDYHAKCYRHAHSDEVIFESDVTAFMPPREDRAAWYFVVNGDTDRPVYVSEACVVVPNKEG